MPLHALCLDGHLVLLCALGLAWAGLLVVLPSQDRGWPRSVPWARAGPPEPLTLLQRGKAGDSGEARSAGSAGTQTLPAVSSCPRNGGLSILLLHKSSSQKSDTFIWLGCLTAWGYPSGGFSVEGQGPDSHKVLLPKPSPPVPGLDISTHDLDRQQGPDQADALGRGVSLGPLPDPKCPALLWSPAPCGDAVLPLGTAERLRRTRGPAGPITGGPPGGGGGRDGASWGRVQSSTRGQAAKDGVVGRPD